MGIIYILIINIESIFTINFLFYTISAVGWFE